MGADTTKNDHAWRTMFQKLPLLLEINTIGHCLISAADINEYGGREARLMAKLDSSTDRPQIFREHKLNILPVERGTYVLFKDHANSCYLKIPLQTPRVPTRHASKLTLDKYDTLSRGSCTTECEAVELAYHASLLGAFCGAESLVLTRRGRFGSNKFILTLPDSGKKIEISNAQIEVDSIYENEHVVVLVEAKIGFREDFHIRQLQYPYMWLRNRTSKTIIPILLCYSNGEFQLTEFSTEPESAMLRVKRQHYFTIDEEPIAEFSLDAILRQAASPRENMSIPFPQADDLDKVIDLVRFAGQGILETEDLCSIFSFVPRQAGYYRNAARYLELIDANNQVTSLGARLVDETHRVNRTELLVKSMISKPVFLEALLHLKSKNFDPASVNSIPIERMVVASRSDLSGDTIRRRSETVRQWLWWILANCQFNKPGT